MSYRSITRKRRARKELCDKLACIFFGGCTVTIIAGMMVASIFPELHQEIKIVSCAAICVLFISGIFAASNS